eukprot:NODE_382_length_1416_cov_190.104609_g282_i0.p1 GENE.NODE_382_length_1416_cov_190.104609_g282_i0~~NODE_382_length_1416_cov_190.104609_g282_i0.p1  ORF type:complete len:264 (-),score=92.77 NODE_382_length_1416_cov_190.104609_g282_i0:62-853(-)
MYSAPVLPELDPLRGPPLEEQLLQSTLWPERIKLYGHPNEIVCLAATAAGNRLASACKAQTLPMAEILIWDTASTRQLYALRGHALTVTQLQYNPSDTRLLSVSRDRHFATGSRDALVKVWLDEKMAEPTTTSAEPVANHTTINAAACTALSFAPTAADASAGGGGGPAYLLAIGTEPGAIELVVLHVAPGGGGGTTLHPWRTVPRQMAPQGFLHRLAFQRPGRPPSDRLLRLAACAEDHSLRIFGLRWPTLPSPANVAEERA